MEAPNTESKTQVWKGTWFAVIPLMEDKPVATLSREAQWLVQGPAQSLESSRDMFLTPAL